MDLEQALVTAAYNRLVSSPDLAAALGGPPAVYLSYPDEAEQAYPFVVHRLEWNSPEDLVTRHGYYSLALWDRSDTAARLFAMRAEIVALFDVQTLTVPELVVARFWLDTPTGFVPDPEPGVWHYEMRFYLRTTRSGEIQRQLA